MNGAAVETLDTLLEGEVLRPGDTGYDKARTIWNAMISRRPAVIARCKNVADVQASVRFARDNELLVSVRGGGHNVAGNAICENGLMIDLSLMNDVHIDKVESRVKVGGGATLGELDRATHAEGVAVPSGIVSETGVGGLTLGGGVGWLVRKYGMTCDNLISAEVVMADGRVMTASAYENDDLYWGVRGGGGNFGIVTTFEFKAHPVSTVVGGMILFPREDAGDVYRFYRDFTKQAPLELTAYCACLCTPDGAPVTAIIGCYSGDLERADSVLAPLRNFGNPIADTMAEIPRIDMQTMFDAGFPYGNRNYWKSAFVDELTDEAIDVIVARSNQNPSPMSALMVEYYYGGPSSDIGETETAFAHRSAQYDIGITGQWTDASEDEQNIAWVRDTYDSIAPFNNGRIYANLMGSDQMGDELKSAFGPNYERLVELKRKYDPDNFFRLNQNIKP